ncbi:MAG: hypothetical protein RLY93_20870 [Sumerlaeia bacterium]
MKPPFSISAPTLLAACALLAVVGCNHGPSQPPGLTQVTTEAFLIPAGGDPQQRVTSRSGNLVIADGAILASIDSGSGNVEVGNFAVVGRIGIVSGNLTIGEGGSTGPIEMTSGNVTLAGSNFVEGSIESVSGNVTGGENVSVSRNVEVLSGNIAFGPESKVGGRVESISGTVTLDGVRVSDKVDTVSGAITIRGGKVKGGVKSAFGDITLADGAKVEEGVSIYRNDRLPQSPPGPPRILIGPDVEIEGGLKFERPVELFVHPSASIGGEIQGAEPRPYEEAFPATDPTATP